MYTRVYVQVIPSIVALYFIVGLYSVRKLLCPQKLYQVNKHCIFWRKRRF
jgi:hypothetical protein